MQNWTKSLSLHDSLPKGQQNFGWLAWIFLGWIILPFNELSCNLTTVIMEPLTGRRHQLRVHCHSLGHTILGDYTYSDRSDTKPDRMYLHAYKIHLPNSIEGLLASLWHCVAQRMKEMKFPQLRLKIACQV